MKLIFVFLLIFPIVTVAAGVESQDIVCKNWTREIVRGQKDACSDLCPQSLVADKYEYVKGLKAAFSSRQGLSRFIAYTGRSTIMGAGADAQACTLHSLLLHWGDKYFSVAVANKSIKTRERTIGLLDYAAVPNFRLRFPKTYALATHDE